MKKIHTLGNSLGANRKSLNISQNFGDSSLNDFTLAKTGKMNNLNLSSLLKSNLLDEDGIEDLHFYFVSFNQHKQGILKQHEVMIKGQKRKIAKNVIVSTHKKISKVNNSNNIDEVNLNNGNNNNNSNNKTIESVEEEELF